MKTKTDGGRSVFRFAYAGKPVAAGLSLLLVCAAAGTVFSASETVHAEEERKPLAAVSVAAEPLVAVAVTAQTAETKQYEPLEATSLIPEVKRPDSYVNEYLGFTRTDLVSYLVENADEYLGTPYKEETVAPVLGKNGHMQCEGFIWDVMLAVATKNENDIPCGNILTEPANGGGWVNWSYYHNVDPITFNTKEEMLASGILEKGDVIWSFDYAGPYGLSNANHVGFFWGDNPHDDKFWESAVKTGTEIYAGTADGNRIAEIESMSKTPSVWWVFKLSPDTSYESATWAGLPAAGAASSDEKTEKPEKEEKAAAEETAETAADKTAETPADTQAGTENVVSGSAESSQNTAAVESSSDVQSSSVQSSSNVQDSNAVKNAAGAQNTAGVQNTAETPAAETPEQTVYTEEDTAYKAEAVSSSYESKSTGEMIFYNGQDADTGYYSSFGAAGDSGYYGY